MDTIYLAYIAGVLTPVALALFAKALVRIPKDLKAMFATLALFLKG